MRSYLFTFDYDGITLYERINAPTNMIAMCIFEREWPNATLQHIMCMN